MSVGKGVSELEEGIYSWQNLEEGFHSWGKKEVTDTEFLLPPFKRKVMPLGVCAYRLHPGPSENHSSKSIRILSTLEYFTITVA